MPPVHMEFAAHIDGTPEAIFDAIADMPKYGTWLSKSASFGATTEVDPYPVGLGTTYLDAGPTGSRRGTVTMFNPPHLITFHQTMPIARGPLRAEADIDIRYTLARAGRGTDVLRLLDLTLEIAGFWKIATPLIVQAFRSENERTLAALRRHVENAAR